MSDSKISALTDGTTPAATDAFAAARSGGTTVKLTWAEILAAIKAVTLDLFAAPAAAVAMNAKKITALANGTAAQDAAAFGQLNQLLATHVYAPASQTVSAIVNASLTVLDATNLTIAFTAPLSGKVLVRFTGMVACSANNTPYNLGLFAHGTSTVVGTVYSDRASPAAATGLTKTYEWLITGLTPGASLQYDLMGSAGGSALAVYAYGPTAVDLTNQGGPATFEVWSA